MPFLMNRLTNFSLVLCLALPACGKKVTGDDDDDGSASGAPPPPSPYTVSLDLSVSEGGTNTDDDAANFTANTSSLAYGASSFIVLGISGSLASQLVVPVLLLKGAASAKAMEVTPGTYLWSYDFTHGGAKYTANLTGKRDDSSGSNTFTMNVTRDPENGDGCCKNFLFFTGANDPQENKGAWQIFDPSRPTGQEKLFSIAYVYKEITERTLTYTVNSDRPASQKFGQGTTVIYDVKGTTVTMTYQDSSEQGSRIISWDKDTLAGSIVDLQGQKLCWDTQENGNADIPCP
jgi:hypothetical protein